MKAIALVLVLAAMPAAGFDLKGVQLGQPTTAEAIERALDGLRCRVLPPPDDVDRALKLPDYSGSTVCDGQTRIAGVLSTVYVSLDRRGNVDEIDVAFSASDFATMRAALVGKIGNPNASAVNAVQNRFGAKLQRHVMNWNDASGTVRLSEYATFDKASLLFRSAASLEASAAAKAHAKSDI